MTETDKQCADTDLFECRRGSEVRLPYEKVRRTRIFTPWYGNALPRWKTAEQDSRPACGMAFYPQKEVN